MPTTARDIANCPVARRPYYLEAAFKLGGNPFACVMTCYLIHDYKKKQNKRKALFIYDECLRTAGSISDDDLNKIDLHAAENVGAGDIAATIETARTQRNSALEMSWFKRVTSSSGRTVPADLFDTVLETFLANAHKTGNVWRDVTGRIDSGVIGSQMSYKGMLKNLPRLKEDLKKAEFDLKNVGIATLNPVTAS